MATNFTNYKISSILVGNQDHRINAIPFHGTSVEWDTNKDYIPKEGEIVVFDDETADLKIKIGDGITKVKDLEFALSSMTNDAIDAICN